MQAQKRIPEVGKISIEILTFTVINVILSCLVYYFPSLYQLQHVGESARNRLHKAFSKNINSHCNFLLNYTRKSLTILQTSRQQVVFAYSFKQRLDNLQQASQEYQSCCKAVTTTPTQTCCNKTVTKLTTVTILLYHDFSPVTRAIAEIRILNFFLFQKKLVGHNTKI